jgi:hypothetical protein
VINSKFEIPGGGGIHWRSLGLFSNEATRRAPEGEQMVGGSGACSPVIFLKIMGA